MKNYDKQQRRRLPQDDLPYERQMYYIIKDYRRMTEKLERLTAYAKQLEDELEWQKIRTSEAKAAEESKKDLKKEIGRLHVEIEDLKRRLKSKFSNARCCVCGKQVKSGYVCDGKTVICSDKCGHVIFKDDPAAFDILVEEGNRMAWFDDLTGV